MESPFEEHPAKLDRIINPKNIIRIIFVLVKIITLPTKNRTESEVNDHSGTIIMRII